MSDARKTDPHALATRTSFELEAQLASHPRPTVVLLPVGSVEPHGPHLPLVTDTLISLAAAERAVTLLAAANITALIAPSIPYGVTDYAQGFAGAVSVPAPALIAYLRAVVEGLLAEPRFSHVCVINNHLEPAHDQAVRDAIAGLDPRRTSVASPLVRRWARTLSDEFKRGECHAGRYETSILLGHAPHLVDQPTARALPDLPIRLSAGIRSGLHTFTQMGMSAAYAGSPATASAAEGNELIDRLAAMVAGEITEHLAL